MNNVFRRTPLPLCALETTVWTLLVCPRAVLTKCVSLVGTTDHTETPAYASWGQIIKQMKWLPLSFWGSIPALGVQCGLHGCVQPALGKCSWKCVSGEQGDAELGTQRLSNFILLQHAKGELKYHLNSFLQDLAPV